MNELISINYGIMSLRPSALPEVILYGDKMFSDKSNQQILWLSITLRTYNGLRSPYFKYLNVILSTNVERITVK